MSYLSLPKVITTPEAMGNALGSYTLGLLAETQNRIYYLESLLKNNFPQIMANIGNFAPQGDMYEDILNRQFLAGEGPRCTFLKEFNNATACSGDHAFVAHAFKRIDPKEAEKFANELKDKIDTHLSFKSNHLRFLDKSELAIAKLNEKELPSLFLSHDSIFRAWNAGVQLYRMDSRDNYNQKVTVMLIPFRNRGDKAFILYVPKSNAIYHYVWHGIEKVWLLTPSLDYIEFTETQKPIDEYLISVNTIVVDPLPSMTVLNNYIYDMAMQRESVTALIDAVRWMSVLPAADFTINEHSTEIKYSKNKLTLTLDVSQNVESKELELGIGNMYYNSNDYTPHGRTNTVDNDDLALMSLPSKQLFLDTLNESFAKLFSDHQ